MTEQVRTRDKTRRRLSQPRAQRPSHLHKEGIRLLGTKKQSFSSVHTDVVCLRFLGSGSGFEILFDKRLDN